MAGGNGNAPVSGSLTVASLAATVGVAGGCAVAAGSVASEAAVSVVAVVSSPIGTVRAGRLRVRASIAAECPWSGWALSWSGAAGMSGGVAYVWNKSGNFDYFCNMDMVELSLIEDASYQKELHELIRQHYLYTGSKLARTMLDNWNHYVEEFIQVVPIEYKKVLQSEKMEAINKKIAQVEHDY